MKESVTYQAIVEEGFAKGREEGVVKGRLEGVRHSLFLLGEELFQTTTGPRARASIEAVKLRMVKTDGGIARLPATELLL